MSSADFKVLGLATRSDAATARTAYRKLALKYHPDKNPAPEANAKYLEIVKAYENILRAENQSAEADALLADPFADILGEGWARAFATGKIDPTMAFENARSKANVELGGYDPIVAAAAELGLDPDSDELVQLLAASGLGPVDLDRSGGGMPRPSSSSSAAGGLGGDEVNIFKQFFDAMPEHERGPMLDLFEKTFPAFLAQEMEEGALRLDDELFNHALKKDALPNARGRDAQPKVDATTSEQVEALNAEAVAAFGEDRLEAAADALTQAISLDPSNASLYGNRSLALEKMGGRLEDALDDADRATRCDATYVPAYERKARALIGLQRYAEAEAALRRGLLLDPEHAAMSELHEEASKAAMAAKIEIVRKGKQAIDAEGGGDTTESALASLSERVRQWQ